jgi:protein phosphatase
MWALATLAVVIALGVGSAAFLRWAHFVGADEASGHVAVYQGLPIELFAGVKLYHEVQSTSIAYASLDPATRKKLFDHTIRSKSSAVAAAQQAGEPQP